MGNWNAAILGGDTEVEFLQSLAQRVGIPLYEGELSRRILGNSDCYGVLEEANSDVFRSRLEAISDDELQNILDKVPANPEYSLLPAACLYMAAGAKLPEFLKEACLFWCDEPTQPAEGEDEEDFEDRAATWLDSWTQPEVRQRHLTAFAELLRAYDGTPLNKEAASLLIEGFPED